MNTPTESMRCPVCVVPLSMSERQGIEIDYCPQCRGVWLDRGELDKIIERNALPPTSVAQSASAPGFGRRSEPTAQPAPAAAPAAGGHHHHYYGHKKHWLVDLFD